MNPLFSIIIPTYNRAHIISKTLNSVLAQTYNHWECIIVDDGSSDNTDEVIAEFCKKDERFRYYKRPGDRKKGPCSCRNYGFELSNGSWINWFDSDDIYKPNALNEVMLASKKKIDAVVVKTEKIDTKTKNKIGENVVFSDKLFEDYFLGNITFYVCGPFWSKVFLQKQRVLFDEKIRYLDDWDFNLRMLYQKPNLQLIEEVLISYNISFDSLSHEIDKLNEVEIMSEVYSREKQLEIIKKNKIIELHSLRKFVRNRYRTILIGTLLNNHNSKHFIMLKITQKNLALFDLNSLIKTILGYFAFMFFGKGYRFFK